MTTGGGGSEECGSAGVDSELYKKLTRIYSNAFYCRISRINLCFSPFPVHACLLLANDNLQRRTVISSTLSCVV